MTPVTLIVTLILGAAIFYVPKSRIVPILIIGMCFVPAHQALVIAGLNFKVLRILAILATVRMFYKNEYITFTFNKIDKLFFCWGIVGFIAFVILWGTMQSFILKMGISIDTFLIYFVFRNYLRTLNDIRLTMVTLIASMVVLTPFVIVEQFFGKNLFSVMGQSASAIRDGRIRCFAAFSHSILLGSFSASVAPIAIALLKANTVKRYNVYYVIGILCSVYITIASASSGPIISLAAGLIVTLAFRFRKYTGKVTLSVIALVALLHMVMKEPVWHLVARLNPTGSSTGYHRFVLIDKTIKNFSEWALYGVRSVEHWGVWAGDVTSMYIAQAVTGGFLTMVLFIWTLFFSMKSIWKASMLPLPVDQRWLLWGMFSAFFTHCVSFLSVAYFGQSLMLLILSFAIASVLLNGTNNYKQVVNPS